jgi:hypothetical protein
MKIAPVTARPISCDVESPKTIRAETSERAVPVRQFPVPVPVAGSSPAGSGVA